MTSGKPALRPNIAVIGGGHAGLSAALRLASLPWTRLTKPKITLIDRSDRFVFLPMLYELALSQVSQWEIAPKYEDLLKGTGIQFVRANVENLDLSSLAVEGSTTARKNETDDADANSENDSSQQQSDGNTYESDLRVLFDKAVLAVGAEAANIERVPGAADYAMPFYTLSDALALKDRLGRLLPTENSSSGTGTLKNIVVVGGGFSGVELAACLADAYGSRVSLMIVEPSSKILANGTDHNRAISEQTLLENGVTVLYNSRVTSVGPDEVNTTSTGPGNEGKGEDASVTSYPADLVLWTAGSRAASAQSNFGLQLDQSGRLQTDEFLQVPGYEGTLYALGDAAAACAGTAKSAVDYTGGYFGTAQVAVQQAEYAAWNAWADITGKRMLRYRYTHLGEMMVLGQNNATVSTALGVDLDGQTAWVARRLAYLARMPTDRHRRRVAASWAVHPLLNRLGDLVLASQQYRTSV